jgi:Protein of unknown function (DUF2721)
MEYLADLRDLSDGSDQHGDANAPHRDKVRHHRAESRKPMLPDTPSVSQLSHVISQAAAPAFLLGALAAFIAVLISRLNRVIDRTIVLNGISDDDAVRYRLKADLPRLMRRAAMLNRAIFWAVIGSISATLVVIVAFASAFLQIQHERGVAILFLVALGAFTVSLVDFAREVRIALSEFDHHA